MTSLPLVCSRISSNLWRTWKKVTIVTPSQFSRPSWRWWFEHHRNPCQLLPMWQTDGWWSTWIHLGIRCSSILLSILWGILSIAPFKGGVWMSSKVIRCTSCGNLSRTEYSCGCYWCLECCDACPCNYYIYGSPAGCDLHAEEVEEWTMMFRTMSNGIRRWVQWFEMGESSLSHLARQENVGSDLMVGITEFD